MISPKHKDYEAMVSLKRKIVHLCTRNNDDYFNECETRYRGKAMQVLVESPDRRIDDHE